MGMTGLPKWLSRHTDISINFTRQVNFVRHIGSKGKQMGFVHDIFVFISFNICDLGGMQNFNNIINSD